MCETAPTPPLVGGCRGVRLPGPQGTSEKSPFTVGKKGSVVNTSQRANTRPGLGGRPIGPVVILVGPVDESVVVDALVTSQVVESVLGETNRTTGQKAIRIFLPTGLAEF